METALLAKQSLVQQSLGMSMVKQSAQADMKVADILAAAAESVPSSGTRGTQLNISV